MTIESLSRHMQQHRCMITTITTQQGVSMTLYRLPNQKGVKPVIKVTGATLLEALERLSIPEEAKTTTP